MSDKLTALKRRILSSRLASYAEAIEDMSSAEEVDLKVSSQMLEDRGELHISGERILQNHYGDRNVAPSGLVSRLLQSLSNGRANA